MRKSVKISLAAVGLVIVLVAAVAAGLLLWRPAFLSGPECTVPGDPGNPSAVPAVELTVAQLQHASTINAVGLSRGISQQGRIIAVATAYQESSLRNRPDGDRDSVGLFQQRPSQGWGTAEQIIDPVYSSGKFYDALLEVPDWQDMSLTEAAQAVQYSGFPDAYAKWEPQATTMVRGLSGSVEPDLTCSSGSRMPTSEAPQRPPLAGTADATPALASTLEAAQAELGGLTVQLVSDDGMTATVDVTVAGLDPTAAGRSLAAWGVAHGIGMDITEVAVQDRHWVDHEWTSADPIANPAQVVITVSR